MFRKTAPFITALLWNLFELLFFLFSVELISGSSKEKDSGAVDRDNDADRQFAQNGISMPVK